VTASLSIISHSLASVALLAAPLSLPSVWPGSWHIFKYERKNEPLFIEPGASRSDRPALSTASAVTPYLSSSANCGCGGFLTNSTDWLAVKTGWGRLSSTHYFWR